MNRNEFIALDGPALAFLAWGLGLAPEGVAVDGSHLVHGQKTWTPHADIAQAEQCFRGLRARGYTTACTWLGDDRQYGEALVGCEAARAYSVRWPMDVGSEAMALLLTAVLAVTGEKEVRWLCPTLIE